jgi:hypothetical protein
MYANTSARQVWRNGQTADLGNRPTAWEALRVLARNYPSRTPTEALQRPEVEPGAVYAAINKLRDILVPLGISIPTHPDRRGYLLAEQG